MEAGCGKEDVSEKNVENDGKRPIPAWDVGTFLCKRSKAKKFRQLADEEKQAGIQGQWQRESPAREYLERVNCCQGTDCSESMMKKGFTALKDGTWEEFQETFSEKMRASEWAIDRMKEAFDLAAKEAEKMSIAQEIMLKSTDYLRRIIAPFGGQGGVTMSSCARTATVSSLKVVFGGSLLERSTPASGVRFVEKSTIGSNRTGSWSCKQEKELSRRRSSKRMRYRRACAKI